MSRKDVVFNKRQIKKFMKQMEQQVNDIEDGILERMETISEMIKTTSDQIVPVDTGTTKDSYYDDIEVGSKGIKLVTGYDRNNEIDYLYDIYYFVNLSYPQFRNGRQPEWLHKAYAQRNDDIRRVMRTGWKNK